MSLILGCACDDGNGNTGKTNCVDVFRYAQGFGIQNIVANDGTLNQIDLAVASITTEWSDLLTNANRTKRLYPIKPLRNVLFPKEDTQYETDNTGQKTRVRDGAQSVTAEEWEVSNVYVSKIRQAICPRNGVWIYTKTGVIGLKDSDGKFNPIEISAFDANYHFPDGTQTAKMMMAFDFAASVDVAQLWLVSYEDLNTTYNAQMGLIDVNFEEIDAPSAGSIGLRLTTDYGQGLLNNQTVDGLVTANFTVTANGVAVVGLAVTEVADDKYTISYTAETPGDTMVVTVSTSTGFEGSYTYTEVA